MLSQHFTCFHVSQLVCVYTITGGVNCDQLTTIHSHRSAPVSQWKSRTVSCYAHDDYNEWKEREEWRVWVHEGVWHCQVHTPTHTWRCITHDVLRVRWYTRLLPSMVTTPWDTTVIISSSLTLPSPPLLVRSVKLLLFEDFSAMREWEKCWKYNFKCLLHNS